MNERVVVKNPLKLPHNTIFDEIVVWFAYTFIKPIQHWHRRFKIGEMVEYNTKSHWIGHGYHTQLAIVVSKPLDRYDRMRKWRNRRKIAKCLYEVYLIESQKNTVCHFNFLKRMGKQYGRT